MALLIYDVFLFARMAPCKGLSWPHVHGGSGQGEDVLVGGVLSCTLGEGSAQFGLPGHLFL